MFDRDPATPSPLQKGHTLIHFLAHVYFGQTAGWIKVPLGMEVGLRPVLDGHPAPPKERVTAAPTFWPVSIVVKLLTISATAELLLWSPYVIGQTIIFLPCGFFLSSFFFFLA